MPLWAAFVIAGVVVAFGADGDTGIALLICGLLFLLIDAVRS